MPQVKVRRVKKKVKKNRFARGYGNHDGFSDIPSLCVCVCERERERERKSRFNVVKMTKVNKILAEKIS